MKTARLIRELSRGQGSAAAKACLNVGTPVQRLYSLSESMMYRHGFSSADVPTYYVLVSANTVLGEPETYIFAADERGKVLSWAELVGSQRGTLDHEVALRAAGYEVES